ncbi:GMC family oxidoreductase N-terminal domain-containing protein [Pseudobacteriovorax antillogorgiicola]|uniref:Cholesterol oxidase n=1 Tax=Pseudobacteriovorax antillogorgiicola TaxID=1513793 RepID=A0A1Y6C976_9BACT|nr:GMC family oxidoreductase N-terminal domain-containing protein [Pseudobacteriovorax antillogorgiicola]TCS49066.1 cholesterol oxidase [Pseudobacteriovorax antillogorgiicola]SMF52282.1 cholesterol oxidase [Pseudobacteriovorax antillogorgiicola]
MKKFEAIVIGSGFGGGITACRLSKKWPGQVMVIERGKRYPLGSFPRKPKDISENFFNLPDEKVKRPDHVPQGVMTGMYDVRSFEHMDVVTGAGLGGGSLIYANVFMEPPEEIFDERWAPNIKRQALEPYYRAAKAVLGSRPIPEDSDPRRKVIRTEYFKKTAEAMGRESELVDLNVFFGNDLEKPTPIGEQELNRFGKLQTSCTYCAECCMGCNYQSKNSVDMNYLHVAETKYNAEILLEHKAVKFIPIDENGRESVEASGEHGFIVHVRDLKSFKTKVFQCNRLILAAGTLGTNELLLRAKYEFKTMPRISSHLGEGFSGNGDFLSFVGESSEPADPNYGPVITQRVDYNLFKNFDKDRAFILEDASYPSLLAWFAEGQKPFVFKVSAIRDTIRGYWHRFLGHRNLTKVASLLHRFLRHDISWNTSIHLCMGLDKSNGKVSLDRQSRLDLNWPQKDSMSLYEAILDSVDSFKKKVRAKFWFPLPTWHLKRNITVHPLGGAALGENPNKAVTKVDDSHFGELHNYQNIYVADGALFPSAVGANPSATISALAEKVSHGITGEQPSTDL